jgi:anti-anti-sigma factor
MDDLWGNSRGATKQDDVSIIRIRGNLELVTAEEVERSVERLNATGCYKIIVDLYDVVYISSRGWSIFVSKIKNVREHGGDLKLVRMRPEVYEVYKVLEFYLFFRSYTTIEAAAQDFHIEADDKVQVL